MTVLSSIVHDENNISLQQQQDSFRMLAQYLSNKITDLEDRDEMIQKSVAGTRAQISRLDDKISQILSLFLEDKEERRRSFLLTR